MIFCQVCDDCGCILCNGEYEQREEECSFEHEEEEHE